MADTRSTRSRIFDTAASHGWTHRWDSGYAPNTKVDFIRGRDLVVVWFSAPRPRDPATAHRPAQRVTGAYTTIGAGDESTRAILGRDRAGQVLDALRAPRSTFR